MTVIDFPKRKSSRRPKYLGGDGSNMRKFAFRSYNSIVEADDTDLLRDVCLDMDRAESKLRRVSQRLKNVRAEAAAEVQLLTTAETKLSAAIVAALLSRPRDVAPIR
jgi:hypothetical protein